MKQRKIVFVNRYFHPDISAKSQMLSDLAFYLAGEGLRVHVVTSRQRYDDSNAGLLKTEVVGDVLVSRVWSSRFGRDRLTGRVLDYLTFYFSAMWHLLKLVRPGDIIVAKTDPPLISVVAMVVARMRRAHLVNWLHDLFPEIATALHVRGLNGGVARMLEWLRNLSLTTAVANVAIGEKMAKRLKARLPPGNTPAGLPILVSLPHFYRNVRGVSHANFPARSFTGPCITLNIISRTLLRRS